MNGNYFCFRLLRSILLGLWLLSQLPGQAQEETYYFHHLSDEQELLNQRFNFFLYKDQAGLLWIPSLSGINRFDGQTVSSFLPRPKLANQLAEGAILSRFFEDQEGKIWFNTPGILHTYQPQSGQFLRDSINLDNFDPEPRWQLLHYDPLNQECWILADSKLWIYSPERKEIRIADTTKVTYYAYGIQLIANQSESQHHLLIPGSNCWEVRTYEKGQRIGAETFSVAPEPGFKTSSFYLEDEKTLWVGADTGLVKVDLTQSQTTHLQIFNDLNGYPIKKICSIAPGPGGQLIVATPDDGLYMFDRTQGRFTSPILVIDRGSTSPFQHLIQQVYVDQDQNLWVSTDGEGIYYTNLKKRKFRAYLQKLPSETIANHNIMALCEDKQQQLWCLSKEGILALDRAGERIMAPSTLGLQNYPQGVAFFFLHGEAGQTWVCTGTGLYHYREEHGPHWKKINNTGQSRDLNYITAAELPGGRPVFSSYQKGLFEPYLNKGQLQLRPLPELSDMPGTYRAIGRGPGDKVLLAREWEDIQVFQNKDGQLTRDTTIKFSGLVNIFLPDRQLSRVWIGTEFGLFFLSLADDQGMMLEKDTLFPDIAVRGLLQDSLGALWASTDKGIARYYPGQDSYHQYSQADGIPAKEFNINAGLATADGRFVFGSTNGVTIFNPYEIAPIGISARPLIAQLLINDQEAPPNLQCLETGAENIHWMRQISLPHFQNTISFRFAAREYSDPDAVKFRYYIPGIDVDTVYSENRNFARYPNLKPGNYTFYLQATNSDGVWSTETARLNITIRPAWYQTRLFILFLIALGLLVLYQIYQFRIRQVKAKEANLRLQAEYKQREAEHHLEVAEIESAIFRLQMNPHFIFNSLNSIGSYIQQRDVRTANDYLARFSKLMRRILDLAKEPLIELSEEVDLLEQYLLTESIRLEKKFTYEINWSDDIEPDETFIPTMILQPFLENAIWHGIAPKDGPGKILLQFQLKNGGLQCVVEDDGIGRKAAALLHKKQPNQTSKALAITSQRLDLIKAKSGKDARYEIIDLYDAEGLAQGTRVVIQLPPL